MLDVFQKRRWKRLRPGYYPQTEKIKRWSQISTLVLISLIGLVFFTIFLFAWYGKDLPRPDRVRRVEGLSTVILDRNAEVLYDIYGEQNRVPVSLEEMPVFLRQATIAIEDKDFYKHQGFSLRGMGRAIINIFVFRRLQGGSTLTQQLVKNVLLTSERTLPRKIKEFILAIQIERKYTKDEILQMYLNEAPYGGTAWGVETAAQAYFGKHTKDLSLTESVILAGLPAGPTKYSPYGTDARAYIWRSEQVLRRMREDGYITKENEEKVKKELSSVEFAPQGANFRAPHFVMHVKEQLVEQFGEKMVEQGGLKVTTSLDWKIQEQAEKIVKEEVGKLASLKVSNGAALVIDPKTGQILAMVGSKDYSATDSSGFKFNVVTQGLRQPGSAIKPITYATAFKKGYTPATLLMDVETHFPGGEGKPDYIPKNYDGKFRGPIQVRFALGNSINEAAVKMQAMVGTKDVLITAADLGISTLKPTPETLSRVGLSLTLGGGEVRLSDLTSAFAVFAFGGIRHEPISILKVQDSRGKTLFETKPASGKRVLTPEISFLVSHILLDNNARQEVFGPRSWLVVPGKTVSVKTGTTDDKRDNWTIGYTGSVVVGVWVGNNDNSPMDEKLASGVTGAAPIWNRIMQEVLKDKPDEPPAVPSGIVVSQVDAYGGGLPREGIPTRSEYFISGTEPTAPASIYQRLKISKNNGKLANPIEIALGEYEEKDFIVLEEQDPVSTDGKNRWQEGIDAWLTANPDSKYHPPRETSTEKMDKVIVKIKSPNDHAQIDDNDVLVEAEAVSAAEIVKIEVLDGSVKKTVSTDGKNRWQEGLDAWLASNPDPKYHPPRETSTEKMDKVIVKIK
ncbi:PBP1A family penicillin-binding protein, partial [Candidatus Gottesmanbacteria bacterium]|nr:PBP1A family penicillin-binding protein [Candidatus Gottesmanbacteria bacterium]